MQERQAGVLSALKSAVYETVAKHVFRATMTEGVLKGTNQRFRILLVGDAPFLDYFMNAVFEKLPRVVESRRVWSIRSVVRMFEAPAHGIDLCVAVVPEESERHFQGLTYFKSRESIRQMLDLTEQGEHRRKSFRKSCREAERMIRKFGFACRVSDSAGEFERFYHEFYLPLVTRRYGYDALCKSREALMEYLRRGTLLWVTAGGREVAGAINSIEHDQLVGRAMGVLQEEPVSVRNGAQMVLYYFGIQDAKQRGLSRVDFGRSRPFLCDGVYRHKRAWGAGVSWSEEKSFPVYYLTVGSPEVSARFFEQNPVILEARRSVRALVGVRKGCDLSIGARYELAERFGAPGLEALLILGETAPVPVEMGLEFGSGTGLPEQCVMG